MQEEITQGAVSRFRVETGKMTADLLAKGREEGAGGDAEEALADRTLRQGKQTLHQLKTAWGRP